MSHRKISNFVNEDINPCIEERALVFKCLEENLYEKESCLMYFKNLGACSKFWAGISYSRRLRGITPNMPTLVERKKILELKAQGIKSYTGELD